jgi:glycosyltransferase involved in cell wall biosynthesis
MMNFNFFKRKKKPAPLLSVIIPTLNAVTTIQKTLDSIADQTLKNLEIIVVDGQSVDGTLDILKTAAKQDERISFQSGKDKGIYDALNKGLTLCRGDWVCFLGAGDVFHSDNTLSELNMDGYFHQKRVFYGNVIIVGYVSWARDKVVYDGEFDLSKLLHHNICHQAIFYPKSVIHNMGFYNTKYPVNGDWDYNLRCWAKEPFLYVDKKIARFSGGGISSSNKDVVFIADFPSNVIKYFNLDPNSEKLILPDSPFHKVINEYIKAHSKDRPTLRN